MKLLRRESNLIGLPTYTEPGFFTKTSMIQLGYGIWTSLTEVAIGLAFGFSAVTIPQLQKNDSGFLLTTAESAWITSVLNLFSPVGCLLGGVILDRYGRRLTLILCELPMAVGWLYTGFANSALHMIIGRIITGLGIGLSSGAPRVYATEISLPMMRGVLGALMSVTLSIGLTSQALLGSYLEWRTLCYIAAFFTTMLSISNFFLPETPYYVLLKKTIEDTRETLQKYRSSDYDIDDEINHLIQYKEANEIRKLSMKNKCKILFRKSTCKPFWIMIPYIIVSQMSGVTVVTFYAVEILQNSKSTVDANAGNVIMGLTRLFVSIITAFLIYKFKRRGLVLSSCFSISVICVALGLYLMYTEIDTVFPMICYLIYIACASVGFYGMMLLIMCELYPLQTRGTLSGISVSFLNLAIFGANKGFPYLVEEIGLPYTIICFGICAFIGTIFLYFRLPETKGLTLEAIEEFFGGRKSMSQAAQTAYQFGPNSAKTVSASGLRDMNRQVQQLSASSVLGSVPRSNTTDR